MDYVIEAESQNFEYARSKTTETRGKLRINEVVKLVFILMNFLETFIYLCKY